MIAVALTARPRAQQLLRSVVREDRLEDGRQLQPDEHEDGRVDQPDDRLPDAEAHEPRVGRQDPRPAPPGDEPGHDRREDARHAELLRGDVGGRRREQRDDDLDDGVRRAMQGPRHDRADDRPDRESAGPDDDEGNDGARDIRRGAAQREGHRAGGARPGDDGQAIHDQGRRVVEEALPLQDRHDAARHAEPPEDRRRGHGVRWRHDRPERDGGRDRHVGQLLDDEGDGRGREQDQPDRQQQDRPQVGLEVPDGREVRGAEEDRRQEQQEHDVRRELDVGEIRQLAQHDPAEQQQDRVGDPQSPRDVGQRDREGERDEEELDGTQVMRQRGVGDGEGHDRDGRCPVLPGGDARPAGAPDRRDPGPRAAEGRLPA